MQGEQTQMRWLGNMSLLIFSVQGRSKKGETSVTLRHETSKRQIEPAAACSLHITKALYLLEPGR